MALLLWHTVECTNDMFLLTAASCECSCHIYTFFCGGILPGAKASAAACSCMSLFESLQIACRPKVGI
jgi:hypothetical protein